MHALFALKYATVSQIYSRSLLQLHMLVSPQLIYILSWFFESKLALYFPLKIPSYVPNLYVYLPFISCILKSSMLLWQNTKAFVDLVFPNSVHSIIPKGSSEGGVEPMENGIITSVTHSVMSGTIHTFVLKISHS